MLRTLTDHPLEVVWGDAAELDGPSHLFCGVPSSASALCPNCGLPLMRLLSLDLTDERLGLAASGLDRLELLFWWPCGVSREPFFYEAKSAGEVRIVQAGKGQPEDDFPYEDFPRSFPEARATLRPMDRELRDLVERYAALAQGGDEELDEWDVETKFRAATPRHQVGGTPFLFDYETLDCPECSAPMPFLATVADANTDPRGFVGNEFVQVVYFYCPLCRMVGVRQETD